MDLVVCGQWAGVRKRRLPRGWAVLGFAAALFLGGRVARAEEPLHVPMSADRWVPEGAATRLEFGRKEGFPLGLMKVSDDGEVALQGLLFRDGTIELDLKLSGDGMPGIVFRRAGEEGEEFYFRPGQDCQASDDCVQYAPVLHGFMLWNTYPQYQAPAPVLETGWNHLKLVLSGRRLRVYVNGSAAPVLEVPELAGESAQGGLVLRGPAIFASLVLRPGEMDGLPRTALPDPAATDSRYLRRWSVSPLSPLHAGVVPMYDEMPPAAAAWKEVAAERGGLVNLNRVFAADFKAPRQIVWLKTVVDAAAEGPKRVEMGWIGQATVFVNGQVVTTGKNFYYPEAERRMPDGRLSLENGGFEVPLHKGRNEIAVALDGSVRDVGIGGTGAFRTRYGWGLAMRFDEAAGLRVGR